MLRSIPSSCWALFRQTGHNHTSRRAFFSSTWQSSASASASSSDTTSSEHSSVSPEESDNGGILKPSSSPADLDALREAAAKRRRTEWKRRQGGESFLDSVVIHVRAGKGGDGAVAFHREKFQEYGPPAGGDGGRGGDVYLVPTPHLTTLSSVPTRVRADGGGNGSGVWLQGRNAAPTVIRVPLGTVVRELDRDDPRRAKDEWEAADEAIDELPHEERGAAVRARRFVHFPRYEAENAKRDVFREAEIEGGREEREVRIARTTRHLNPLKLDLDEAPELERAIDAPLGVRRPSALGTLIASGGRGGKGNPHFVGPGSRSPKFATRGIPGERVSLALELRILADVGLVGLPNAGKSTLLLALTGGRARTKVADYAFTTLNPVVGVVRCGAGGDFEGLTVDSHVGSAFDTSEDFRFTVADNPGLIARAAENVGLGHAFLKSIERAPVLVYVIDVSGTSTPPEEALATLRTELEAYRPGMSSKARLILANKADLLVPPAEETIDDNGSSQTPDPDAIADARIRLAALQAAAAEQFPGIPVVPVSAAHGQNLRKVVSLLRGFVEEARTSNV